MKRIIASGLTVFFFCSLAFAGPALDQDAKLKSAEKPLKADLTLVASPIWARSIKAGGTVNALEKPADEMPPVWTSVLFRVEKVLSGEFKIPKSQEISLWSQMKDAAEDKNLLKLLTMDFEKPAEDGDDKEWLSIAVIDPYASFGVREGEPPASRQRYKLSLAQVHKDPDSFILVKSEKL